MLKFIILQIVWCIWCLFLDILSSRNEGLICGTFDTFSMRLCLVLRRREQSFSLIHCSQIVNITWILFPRRLNHVCSIVFFSTSSFELHFCGISQTTLCEFFSRGFTELICRECCLKPPRLVTMCILSMVLAAVVYILMTFSCKKNR